MSSSLQMNDKWFRILGIPGVALVAHVLFFYDMNQRKGIPFFTGYSHSVVHAWLLWESARWMMLYTRQRFSSFEDSGKRMNYTLALVTLSTVLVMGSICAIYDLTMFWGYHFTFKKYVYNIFVALMYAVIVGGIYEGIYFFSKWRETFVEAEALKKSNLQSQLESLKGQINPHFLFNSLSSLSSLIADDSERAEKFVDELATVYRYLLQTNEKELTTLERETAFIHSYFHLLKTRFNNALQLKMDIDERYCDYLIPPLTLQILVENAVKHNMLLQDKPLKIRVFTDSEENLIVINNLQKKNTIVASSKMGLANIVTKYRLLKQKKIIIRETEASFQVVIPLIRPEVFEYEQVSLNIPV